ncbi:MAG TPA: lipopolysaccharide biosynthesis protein [Methylophilaceae bacterium]
MTQFHKRIAAAMGANTFGNLVTIGIQLASLPLFLHYWDTARYGLWIIITALPSYFSMADVGMVSVAGNKMTMSMGREDYTAANRTFQSALLFMLGTCSTLFLVSLPFVIWVKWQGFESAEYKTTLVALIMVVLVTFFSGLAEAIFRATHRYALGTMMSNFIRVAEWSGGMVGLWWDAHFSSVAIGMLFARLLGVLIAIAYSNQGTQGRIQWGLKHASWQEVREMFKPAVAFMMFPLSNALSFQGITLLVGYLFGTSTVAIFNTYRTLARLAVQASSIFSHALWVEFSHAFGQGGANAIRGLYGRAIWLGAAIAFGLSFVLYFLAPLLLKLWTHGAIPFQSTLVLTMLAYAAVGGAWHVPRTLLLSTNEHGKLAKWSLGVAVFSVVLAYLLGRWLQVEGVVLAMLISELLIAVASIVFVNQLLRVPNASLRTSHS